MVREIWTRPSLDNDIQEENNGATASQVLSDHQRVFVQRVIIVDEDFLHNAVISSSAYQILDHLLKTMRADFVMVKFRQIVCS